MRSGRSTPQVQVTQGTLVIPSIGHGEQEFIPTPPVGEGLTGSWFFTDTYEGIYTYDLASQQITQLFSVPEDGILGSASLSPDRQWIAMAYAAPLPEGQMQIGYTDLYVMPADGSETPELLAKAEDGSVYSMPDWSPDGKSIYVGHLGVKSEHSESDYGLQIERIRFPDGAAEVVIDNAYWPRFSPDGSRLAYLEYGGGSDGLVVSNSDGSNAIRPNPPGFFVTVDAPAFSADGQIVVFSAVVDYPRSSSSLFEELLGVHVARAHSIPSDLYQVDAGGGTPSILTTFGGISIYPTYSPDGSHIAFLSIGGVYVMEADGYNRQLVIASGVSGTLEWLP
jgi:dipeptidyl aminopeptidase/acylaminoacyl peptidase